MRGAFRVLSLLVLACALARADDPQLPGEWRTSLGIVTFKPEGDGLVATFANPRIPTVKGTVKGKTATLAGQEASGAEPSVDPERFIGPEGARPGGWAFPPQRWDADPERSLQDAEALALVQREIDKLPEMQRLVITMRDVEGWSSQEVRHALEISETNQRVLLHRARSKVRAALEGYFTPT